MKESITATLQQKNNIWQVVISYKEQGKWRTKWKSTRISCVNDRNKRRAKMAMEDILFRFREDAAEEALLKGRGSADVRNMPFSDLLTDWKRRKKFAVSPSTVQGYEMILSYAVPYSTA